MPTIRRALPSDAAALAALAERTFREAFGPDNTPGDLEMHAAASYGEAIQGREIADPGMTNLVCEDTGALVGYAQLRGGPAAAGVGGSRAVEILRFYVDRPWQGRGLAAELMGEALAVAERLGADRLWLGVWERNPRAIAFYRKHGFVEVGEQVYVVGTDRQRDLVMSRPVDPAGTR